MFLDISEAYTVLSDKDKRKQYDLGGTDMEDGSSGFAAGPGFDPNVIFRTFFGGEAGFAGFPTGTFFSSSGSGSGNGDDFGGFGGGSRGFGNAKGGFPGNAQFTFSSSKR